MSVVTSKNKLDKGKRCYGMLFHHLSAVGSTVGRGIVRTSSPSNHSNTKGGDAVLFYALRSAKARAKFTTFEDDNSSNNSHKNSPSNQILETNFVEHCLRASIMLRLSASFGIVHTDSSNNRERGI